MSTRIWPILRLPRLRASLPGRLLGRAAARASRDEREERDDGAAGFSPAGREVFVCSADFAVVAGVFGFCVVGVEGLTPVGGCAARAAGACGGVAGR
ncbi:MAG: hypothetical protein AB7K24_23745 [Gemmataceae bacterium]